MGSLEREGARRGVRARQAAPRAAVRSALLGPALAALLGAAPAAGCCGPRAPEPGKFFRREESPVETLKGFVYAVDTHQWAYAHACLTEASRSEIGPMRLQVAVRFLKEPAFGEVPLFDVISSSVLRRGPPRYNREGSDRKWATEAWILVFPVVRKSDGTRVEFETDLAFRKEDGEWRFDFLGTIDAIQRALAAQGSGA